MSHYFYSFNSIILGLRVGAEIQAAEVSVRAREGAPGQPDPPDPDPGKHIMGGGGWSVDTSCGEGDDFFLGILWERQSRSGTGQILTT